MSKFFNKCILKTYFINWYLEHFLWNWSWVIGTLDPQGWVNVGLGNGLVLSGNKPLPELMLTQIYVAIGITRP